jgi:hypothetical protein
MTKARDLSNIISGGFTADDIPNIDASKITTGTFDASKIGSGTFADARISASSVSQHATSFDDNKIVNDISTLALTQASNDNRSAYNTNSQFVDVFQDTTGLDVLSNSYRNAELEFISSGALSTLEEYDYNGASTKAELYLNEMSSSNNVWYEIDNDGDPSFTPSKYVIPSISLADSGNYPSYSPGNTGNTYWLYDFKSVYNFTSKLIIGKQNTWGDISQYTLTYSNDNSTFTPWDMSGVSQLSLSGSSGYSSGGAFSSGTSSGQLNVTQHSTGGIGTSYLTLENVPTISARYIKLRITGMFGGTANSNAGGGIFAPFHQPLVVTSTGNFTGTTITAPSSVSSMGAIITYQDNAGTNALNTDIVLELSADNGSNWSTATLSALPNFSTGIKMAKVNDLAVTAGTQLKYRLSFANQSLGSKEARIRGVALQY